MPNQPVTASDDAPDPGSQRSALVRKSETTLRRWNSRSVTQDDLRLVREDLATARVHEHLHPVHVVRERLATESSRCTRAATAS